VYTARVGSGGSHWVGAEVRFIESYVSWRILNGARVALQLLSFAGKSFVFAGKSSWRFPKILGQLLVLFRGHRVDARLVIFHPVESNFTGACYRGLRRLDVSFRHKLKAILVVKLALILCCRSGRKTASWMMALQKSAGAKLLWRGNP